MELLKRTEEYRSETEQETENFIQDTKDAANEKGYELISYSATHKVKKDDDYYLLKLVKSYI
jgi:hypothetical protein|nr:MAG TPA: hypothetical protein [Caudoviricetes sp.]